ncbi:DUF3857 domain-containing protein [Chitinophaga silvatica]|uniref:DUF3857 domain-containing protein n=1 Tax=Chitinophaga silvatica TaxID=2282649 RepID=A0A3E1YCM5_9BACT|nr:DUF3857 domain-containing protein [Chitinophaga silvatica]RFS23961.1 DUF3857 domain-containing protein [Chitinophaga silvatica]
MKIRSLHLAILLLLQLPLYAQKARDIRAYKERATQVRNEVWEWDIPAFLYGVKAKIDTTSSAIVVARHVDVKASSSRKMKNLGNSIRVERGKDLFYSNTFREMVKINDKAALEEYSQFSFRKFKNLNSYFHRGLATTIMGVRIIKPNGSIREVNVDEEVVNEQENGREKSKLAIPDLQVGDLIDYFVRVEEQKDVNSPVDDQMFVLGDDKPILQYSVHAEISDKYFVRYRTSNGAPDFIVKKDDDGAVFDLLIRNIPNLPVGLWMSPYRQIPMIRMSIAFGTRTEEGQVAGEIRKNPNAMEAKNVLLKEAQLTDKYFATLPSLAELKFQVKNLLDKYETNMHDEIPEDSLSFYAYYAFRYLAFYSVNASDKIVVGKSRNYSTPNNRRFLGYLYQVMQNLNIPVEYVFVVSRYGPGQNDFLTGSDYEIMLRTKTAKPVYITADGVFSNCSDLSSEYEGQKAPAIELKKSKRQYNEVGAFKDIEIGVSKPEQNAKTEQIAIAFDDNMQLLKMKRKTSIKGYLRSDEQKRLLRFEDYYEAERLALGIEKSFMEEFADSKRNRSLAEEYTSAFEKARTEQKDDFMDEIQEQFDIKPKDLIEYKIEKMGLRHTDPDLVYHTTFTLDGLVKKAGNNYILNAGKLIGEQLQIKPEQRNRKVDVYQPFARTFEYQIELTIPKGYTLEGVDKLNKSVDNECASFTVTSTVADGKLQLKVRKVYKHNFEPVAKWESLLQVLDAAVDFGNQKLLLKKA